MSLTRRNLFKTLPLVAGAFALDHARTFAHTTPTFPKGTHVAKDFNPNYVNMLGCDYVAGDDDIIRDIWAGNFTALRQLTCEYIHRFPAAWNGTSEITSVRANLSLFRNRWIVLNEPSLWNVPATTSAANASQIIEGVVATNPGIQNTFILSVFSAISQSNPAPCLEYVSAVWANMTPAAKAKVNAFAAHMYPATQDPNEVRSWLRDCQTWKNHNGVGALPLYLTETGFQDTRMTQLEAKDYILALAAELGSITGTWFGGLTWLGANIEGYCNLNKWNGLTRAGAAFAGL
ncbi:MAG: hypothetical protein H0U60_13825 [Blastocatellia bacterium]|nr:hypothetical protein [Blastocatellia bacterium]